MAARQLGIPAISTVTLAGPGVIQATWIPNMYFKKCVSLTLDVCFKSFLGTCPILVLFFDSKQIQEGSNSVLCRTCRFEMISTECEV